MQRGRQLDARDPVLERDIGPGLDVAPALERLATRGLRLVAFTNGPVAAGDELLTAAGVRDRLSDVVSADEIRSFKPDPAVYHHLLERVATPADRVVVVSSNSFDVLGARHAGLQAAWVRRTEAALLDPWGVDPDVTVDMTPEQMRAVNKMRQELYVLRDAPAANPTTLPAEFKSREEQLLASDPQLGAAVLLLRVQLAGGSQPAT